MKKYLLDLDNLSKDQVRECERKAASVREVRFFVTPDQAVRHTALMKNFPKDKIYVAPASTISLEDCGNLSQELLRTSAEILNAKIISNKDGIQVSEAFDDSNSPLPFCDLQKEFDLLRPAIEKNIGKVLNHGMYINGPEVKELEKACSEAIQSPHAIACSSGTDSLLLILMALECGPGDIVITTPFTFIATAEVIALTGATAVFVDIDPKTYNISVEKLRQLLDSVLENKSERIENASQIKAVITVDLFGQPADYDEIENLLKEFEEKSGHKVSLVEDAAQSFGARYKGRFAGALAEYGSTSFFPAKPLGCYGDGGMVFTNNDSAAEKIRALLNHGQNERYKHKYIGINGRLDSIQAAVLNAKVRPFFATFVNQRNEVAREYLNALENIEELTLPFVAPDCVSAWAQFSVLAKNSEQRETIIKGLSENGIPSAIHYPMPLHLQEAFAPLRYSKGDFPVAEEISGRIFSLPMDALKSREDIARVSATIKDVLKG